MKAAALQRILERELGYSVKSQRGSHKKMLSDSGYPLLIFSFHDGQEIPSQLVKKILIRDVGLSVEFAEELVGMR